MHLPEHQASRCRARSKICGLLSDLVPPKVNTGWPSDLQCLKTESVRRSALEQSLNNSAERVSAIWVSFLIFALCLVTAASTVTHRQLFVQEPIKLPILNIDSDFDMIRQAMSSLPCR
jgi:hypothetical protein